jgi:hypothetical protein
MADASGDILDAAPHSDALNANAIQIASKNNERRTVISPYSPREAQRALKVRRTSAIRI